MKKTLLFFLLLFTTLFYGQVANIEHCSGDTSFNLTSQKALLIGNLDPVETMVSYHLSLADATDNLNAIASPANFISTESSKTIYARIDNNGIVTTNYFNLIVNPVLTVNTEVVYVNCVPRIVITGNGGNSTYEYSHFGVTYTQTNFINNPSPGQQTVYVRDGNGCVASKTLIVESLSPLTWRAQSTRVTCEGANDGTAEITASGGKAPYLFSYGNENIFTSSNLFRNLSVGTHTINIQDATGCVISLLVNIYQANPSIAMVTTITNASDSNNDGKISLNVSGGVPPYTFSIKDNGNPIPSQTSNPFTGLAVGSYEVIVTDSKGCTLSKNGISILNTPTPLTTTFAVTPITCVITTGTITITPNGGTLPYEYSIDNGNSYSNSNVFSNLVAGPYNIKVRDAQNSIVSAIATVDPISLPIITTTYKSILCHGDSNGSILVGASNGKAPNLFSINGGAYTSYNLFENLSAGNYVLSVKDSNGCIVTTSVLLQDPAPITAEIKIIDRSVTITASGGYGKYDYALDGGIYKQSNIFSNVSYGNHTINVKDPNNCVLSKVITVIKPLPLASSFEVNKGTITINTTGGVLPYRYALQNARGFPINTTMSNIFTDMVNGTYHIVVTDSNGSSVILSDIIISESSTLALTANATSTPITCIDSKSTITVTANGGRSPYQYSIANPTNFTNSNVFSNLGAGNYTITVRDSNNFMTTAGVTISNVKPLLVTSEIVSEISCNGANNGTVKANVAQGLPPYSYSLDGANYQPTAIFTNLSPGTHTISVLDQNGCTGIVPVTLLEPKILKSSVVVNGSTITAYTTDGTAPYHYTLYGNDAFIAGPQTSETFTNLITGLYSLKIRDAKGCELLRNDISIISDLPPLSATIAITPITCNNPLGTITVNATGGSGSYVYSLNNNPNYSVSNIFSDLSPGNYIINVRDSQNAIATVSATIIAVNPLVVTAVVLKDIDCFTNATINVTAQGGKKPYLYSLDNGQTYSENNTFTNINAGIYVLRVKDSLDCVAITNSIAIQQSTPISVSATYSNVSAFNSNDGSITVSVNGGTAPYIYSLLDSNNITIIPDQLSNTFNNLAAGTYSIIVKDAKGCLSLTQVTILEPTILTVTATVNQATCNNPTGTITVTAMGGSGIYEYSIDNGTTYTYSPVFTNLQPGFYTITVKDSQNGLFTTTIMIAPVNPVHLSATITSIPSCVGSGTITAIATGGKAPYIYSLNGGAYLSSNTFNVYAGIYTLTVQDSNGCTESQTIILDPPVQLVAFVTVADQTITINATGGSGTYEYSIDGVAFQPSNVFTNLPYGVYPISVRDQNGCTVVTSFSIDPPAPSIDGKNTITIEFKSGQTLEDLIIEGQNIKWYNNSNNVAKKTNKSSEATLPLSTLLVDGTTYYASQTINGIESTKRLAVTAKLNSSLSTPDFTLRDFTYYPNPVQHTLSISNTSNIDEVEIFSISGKSVLTKKINSDHSEIDMSNVASGVYFIKVKAEGKTKTIKIVKK